jgi:hypothetical protein
VGRRRATARAVRFADDEAGSLIVQRTGFDTQSSTSDGLILRTRTSPWGGRRRRPPPTADPADQWRSALTAVLRAESEDFGRCGASIVCRAVLDVLAATPRLDDPQFGDAVDAAPDRLPLRVQITLPNAFRRGLLPEAGAAEVLAECSALSPPAIGQELRQRRIGSSVRSKRLGSG